MLRTDLFAGTLAVAFTSLPSEADAQCRTFDAGTPIATLSDPRIDEASGIAASWFDDEVLWVHNDSGDSARVFAITRSGATRAEVVVNGALAVDWEDIAVGPCGPSDATPCVWVADIGDNDAVRPSVALYRFPEPVLTPQGPVTLEATATAFTVTYDGGPRNAETLLVHPTDGTVYIVDKTVGNPSNVWLVPTDGTPATIVATFDLDEVGINAARVTGGDFSPDGLEVSIRTYTHYYTFCGADLATAFASPPAGVIATHLAQSEALTYARDQSRMYTTTEVLGSSEPAILEILPAAVPADADVGPPDVGRPSAAPDIGTPAADVGPDVVLSPDEERRGCACGTGKQRAEHWLVLGAISVCGIRVRVRKRLRGS